MTGTLQSSSRQHRLQPQGLPLLPRRQRHALALGEAVGGAGDHETHHLPEAAGGSGRLFGPQGARGPRDNHHFFYTRPYLLIKLRYKRWLDVSSQTPKRNTDWQLKELNRRCLGFSVRSKKEAQSPSPWTHQVPVFIGFEEHQNHLQEAPFGGSFSGSKGFVLFFYFWLWSQSKA